jgi:hypothetical protein
VGRPHQPWDNWDSFGQPDHRWLEAQPPAPPPHAMANQQADLTALVQEIQDISANLQQYTQFCESRADRLKDWLLKPSLN